MIQIGVIMIAMAIAKLLSGGLAPGLICLSAGLLFISGRKSDLGMKVTLKSLVTPVDDGNDTGPFVAATRFAAYAVFAVAMVVTVTGWIAATLH